MKYDPITQDKRSQKPPKAASRLWLASKIVLGVALIAFLFFKIDLAKGWNTILSGDPSRCAIAFLFFGLSRLAEGIRLFFLIQDSAVSMRRAVKIVFVSTFFNNFAAFFVGDGYRIVALRRHLNRLDTATTIVITDRLLGIFAIFGLALAYIPFIDEHGQSVAGGINIESPGNTVWIALIIATLVSCALLVFFIQKYPGVLRRTILANVSALRSIGGKNWVFAIASSFAAQLFVAGMTYQLILAFGGYLPLSDTVFVMLFVFVASFIPITIGSLGIREGALVLGLVAFGLSRSDALTIALVSRIMIYQYAFLAGILVFFERRSSNSKQLYSDDKTR